MHENKQFLTLTFGHATCAALMCIDISALQLVPVPRNSITKLQLNNLKTNWNLK